MNQMSKTRKRTGPVRRLLPMLSALPNDSRTQHPLRSLRHHHLHNALASSASSRQFASRAPQLAGPSTSSFSTLASEATTSHHSLSSHTSHHRTRTATLPSLHLELLTQDSSPTPQPTHHRHAQCAPTKSYSARTVPRSPTHSRAQAGTAPRSSRSGKNSSCPRHRVITVVSLISKTAGGRETARNSSSTSGTRSSTLTAVNSLRDSASTAVFGGNGLMMLQVKTASGGMLAFDPLQTMPGALIFVHSLSEMDRT